MILEQFYKQRDDTLYKDATLQDVIDKMYELHLHYIVLLDEKEFPVGILTETDLLMLYGKDIDFSKSLAYDFSSKELVKAHKDRTVEHVLNLFIDHSVKKIVVIDDNSKFLGVIEQEDVVFAYDAQNKDSSFKIYEIVLNDSKAFSVDINKSLGFAVEYMKENMLDAVLISKNKKSIGIITKSDIVTFVRNGVDENQKVEKFMRTPLQKLSINSSIRDCIDLMRKKRIRRVVIEAYDENHKIIDYIITTKDILNNLQGNYSKFLEEKLNFQKLTFENLKDLVIEAYDLGGKQVISWANSSAKRELGIEVDDLLDSILPSSIIDEAIECLKNDRCYIKEHIELKSRFYRLSIGAIEMFDSKVLKILLSDFTELFVSNKKLHQQIDFMSDSIYEKELMLEEIVNQNAMGIGYIDKSGEIIFANKFIHNLLGYNEGELVGKKAEDITYEEDREKSIFFRNKLLELSENENRVNFEKRYITKDDSIVWVNVSMASFRDKMGSIKYIVSFVKDISERKRIEKELFLSKAVFDNTIEGIVIADENAKIKAINSAFTKILGYTKEEVLQKPIGYFRTKRHKDSFYTNISYEITSNGFWQGEIWVEKKNGKFIPIWLNVSTHKDKEQDVLNYICVFSDISMRKKSEEKLEFLAHHDILTKLPNRLLLNLSLEQSIKRAKRDKKKVAVIFLDLDKFKEINDTFGHSYGDKVLVEVTNRLKSTLREEDTIGRIGGDEFIIIIEDFMNVSKLEPVLKKILDIFKTPILIYGQKFKISCSIGVAVYPEDGLNIENLIKNADAAMYEAKDAGRNTYRFYNSSMTQDLFSKMLMKNELDRAIKHKEFVVYYQPQVSILDNKLIGLEALVRWKHPSMGLLFPDKFVSIAEDTKQILDIGEQVLLQACKDIKRLHNKKLFHGRVAVNVSAVQIKEDNFYEIVVDVLKRSGLDGRFLELELTESYIMENPKESIKLFKRLKEIGVVLSIDDFGTGYSSLSYLKQLPVDKLKIDRAFIMDIPQNSDDVAITSTIIAMSKSLRLGVIAEGIETKKQHNFLKKLGCYEGQGYLYGEPLCFSETEKFLKASRFANSEVLVPLGS